ncbi:glycoside hydrolase family 18 protein [Galbibacter sp. EGI 63066]|uniref:glycoside hydrolase family 18 protein n=1 Tax=Galbibacter sp. EGI 63066 TaxID=2993559 RepID=UPI0022494C6C|nr:glycoside hydrolase family 18 protein [Galbibacter sp. EGI 63066]MCX2680092.1 glycoside hydrolase family 18 protein [Galbibacter sp. EGI 63066]
MKRGIFFTGIFLLIYALGHSQDQKTYTIVGYVYSGHINNTADSIAVEKLTHINYAFANIKDGKIIEGHSKDSLRLAKINTMKSINPDLKLLVSVGGWSWSDHFSDAVLTKTSREVFANSAADFILKHKLNGIDLDWEYPGQPGEGNTYRSEDKGNFTLALKRIREKLDSLTSVTDENYLLTIASGANQKYLDHIEMDTLHHYLDYINIMGYDFHGEWNTETGHHCNLYESATDTTANKRSVLKAINQHIEAGAPVEKLVMGVAFYGRGWYGVQEENNGLHQWASKGGFSIPYRDISDSIAKGNFQQLWDKKAKAPFLWNKKTRTFISYESSNSLKEKTQLIKEKKMGGAMFWEYHADNGTLLNTLYRELSTPESDEQ